MKEILVFYQRQQNVFFPEDDLGPGAIGLDVPYFIDHQLAGNYGSNSKEYMQGPFDVGTPTQGYQSRLTRAEIFRQGIQKNGR
ncbi:gluconate 2-dehydrogenase subunit 3 family protein [Lysinibacillus sp. MHQ-1]|nr:gluconate 2-dehydrogenase subunit 3 family protein [Lysinibacillus sp. MHQ-1]